MVRPLESLRASMLARVARKSRGTASPSRAIRLALGSTRAGGRGQQRNPRPPPCAGHLPRRRRPLLFRRRVVRRRVVAGVGGRAVRRCRRQGRQGWQLDRGIAAVTLRCVRRHGGTRRRPRAVVPDRRQLVLEQGGRGRGEGRQLQGRQDRGPSEGVVGLRPGQDRGSQRGGRGAIGARNAWRFSASSGTMGRARWATMQPNSGASVGGRRAGLESDGNERQWHGQQRRGKRVSAGACRSRGTSTTAK